MYRSSADCARALIGTAKTVATTHMVKHLATMDFFVSMPMTLLLCGAFMREPVSQTKSTKTRGRQIRVTGAVLEFKD
jgi:hypothetical protein